ncbi:MAG: hypothetical protein GF409_02300 [Candidatus Omnitrophica bacterium]|nr:hypothetical protein [Candidatus Omnitrophota bacterium]
MKNICSKCILSDSMPGIELNEQGICNICQKVSRNMYQNKREEELISILKNRKTKSKYDCICLYSGGKDSTYMLYNLVEKYRLNVLAFTLDNWFLSSGTFDNIEKVVSKLAIDHIIYKPRFDIVSKLFKYGIENYNSSEESQNLAYLIGHVCWPCFAMISLFSIKQAIKKNIPSIVVGTTPGQLRQKDKSLISKYEGVVDVYKNMIIPFLNILDKNLKKEIDLSFFEKIKAFSLKLVPFYEYVAYSENTAINEIKNRFNWQKPSDTDSCSSNCLINSLGIALHNKLYNVNSYVIPLAHDVRLGLIDREEALKAVNSKPNEKIIYDIAQKLELEPKSFM